MSRRMIVATVLVLAALAIGVGRSLTHQPDAAVPAVPAPVVSAPPTGLPGPSVPAGSTSSAGSTASGGASEPVDEGSGDGEPSTPTADDAGPAGDTGADGAQWEPVAVGFARSFTTIRSGDTNATWRIRLHPYVTAAVDKQLGTVDITNVPEGSFDSLDVLETSDEQVSVQATYSPGWALVLYLISDGHDNWKVYGYDHLEQ